MIAKKNILNTNELQNSSLQFSLQRYQLSLLTCLQVQEVFIVAYKERNALNQHVKQFSLAGLFVNNPN